jgi:hypothetical protein
MALITYFDIELYLIDVRTTFLNGHISEDVYEEHPKGFQVNEK